MANFFIRIINYVISACGSALLWMLDILPDTPFQDPNNVPPTLDLGYITWIIPFPTMILHLTLLLSAIGSYYTLRVIMRWIKMSRS